MKQLKTLKDFYNVDWDGEAGKNAYYENWIRIKDLKAEAIKWVKAHGSEESGFASICNLGGWKHFFNITEEDLKEKQNGN